MIGRRRPDVKFGELPDDIEPGDYWKYLNRKTGEPLPAATYNQNRADAGASNLTGTVWGYASPDGNGIGTLAVHTVREHDDGTISVLPGDGSSNSILHSGGPNDQTWHGYIYDGEWREA